MKTFCQNTPEQEIKNTTFIYNKDNNLVEKMTYIDTVPVERSVFIFGSNKKALAYSIFDYRNGAWELNLYFQYKYN